MKSRRFSSTLSAMILSNEMILASAGSGKTYQLTNRYIGLMAMQLLAERPITPERIIAVTFTRKAAGEFFDSILEKLAKAATDPEEIAAIGAGEDSLSQILARLSPEQYNELLRIFIGRMPRLFLGTLDSFFSNVLRSFPSEFGLAGDFEILDQHLEELARKNVYRTVFQRSLVPKGSVTGDESDPAQREFLEAFRQATFGKEQSRIRRELDDFISDLHGLHLEAPEGRRWGNSSVVWPDGCAFLGGEKVDWEKDFAELFELFRAADDPDGGKDAETRVNWKYWEEFRDEAPLHKAGAKMTNRVSYMLGKLLPHWAGIQSGTTSIKFGTKMHAFGPRECAILKRILQNIVGAEIETKLRRTQGVWKLLDRYESTYSDRIRRQGKLTFHDLALLLAGTIAENGDSSAPILTQTPDEVDRLQIDYRLDARYDHWLLDEFQDTSHLQWKVIENLIDEVVQDTSGERSLFQVGDVKQSIYGWRGGDPGLFGDIFRRYNRHEERLVRRDLDVSFRSGHDVIDTVNRVFGSEAVLEGLGIPSDAIHRWEWNDHEVSERKQSLAGYTALLNPTVPEDENCEEEDRFSVAVGILEEMQPIQRGIECAILVQSNKVSRRIVDYIRAESDIPVMSEADVSIATDNALNRAALSYLQLAAHPADRFAWEHLLLTPFREIAGKEKLTPAKLSAQVRDRIFEKGFEAAIRHFIRSFSSLSDLDLDEFSLRRAEDLSLAARTFDEEGKRDIDEFLAFARNLTIREPDAKSAVQVMTIHKSKGLTFDAVILPDLEGNALTTARNDIGAKKNEHREVEWVFDLPKKEIYQHDETLSSFHAERESDAAYENLCKLYVAMTRARCANYLITNPRSKRSKSQNFVALLEAALVESDPAEAAFGDREANVLYETDLPTSDRSWFANRIPSDPPTPLPMPTATIDPSLARPRVARRTPSGSEKSVVTAAQIFSREGRSARNFGTLVHAIFEDIEWFDEETLTNLKSSWQARATGDPETSEALTHVVRSLDSRDFREALSKPSSDAEVWQERRFEILLDDQWLSGTFDRVVVEKNRATIVDFKTDRVQSDEDISKAIEKYRPQLDAYSEVLQRMTGLPKEAIGKTLLFSTPRKAVSL